MKLRWFIPIALLVPLRLSATDATVARRESSDWKAGRPCLYLGHVNYRGRGNYHGRVNRRSQGQSCFRPCEPVRKMPTVFSQEVRSNRRTEARNCGSEWSSTLEASDPGPYSLALWTVTTIWLSAESIAAEESFPSKTN